MIPAATQGSAGQRVFGENRVQEAKGKWPGLRAAHDGLEVHLIGPLQVRDLMMPGSIVFSDLGQSDGVRVGDFVTVRRESAERVNAADTIDEAIRRLETLRDGPATTR